jgi:hypothetical protein
MSVSDPQPFGSLQVNGASGNEALLRVNSNAHSREFSTVPLADLLSLGGAVTHREPQRFARPTRSRS